MLMATLQVKRLPETVHRTLKQRAEQEGISLSDLVIRVLSNEAALPSLTDWRAGLAADHETPDIDIQTLMDGVRGER